MDGSMREVRCINCNKKLAEVTMPDVIVASTASIRKDMTIKCPRCSVITAIRYPLEVKYVET